MQHLTIMAFTRRMSARTCLVVVVPVDLPRGLQGQQAERLDLHPRVGNHLLHQLLAAERLTLGVARDRPLTPSCRRSAGPGRRCASRDGSVRLPTGSVRRRTPAARPEHVIGWDADVFVADVAFPAAAERLVSQADVAQHIDARVSPGTTNIECRLYGGASGSVTAMTIRNDAIDANGRTTSRR